MIDVTTKLEQAYVTLVTAYPFFATMLLRLERVEDPTCKTMWTDGRRLGYSPKFVDELSRDELVGVLCHEVLHVAGLHPWRREERKAKAWNVACDQAVNSIVKEAGLLLPAMALPGIPDKAAEELYVEPPEDDSGSGGNGPPPPQPKGGGTPGAGKGDQPSDDPGGCGEVRDPTNDDGSAPTPAEVEQQMQEAKIGLNQAINAAKRAGKLPAELQRYVDEALEPKVPWKEILSQFIDAHTRDDFCWARPNRRYISSGIMFPSLYSPAYGEVVLGCDTSGSIDQQMLKEVCSEVLGVMEAYTERGQSPELTVAWFDTKVYEQVVDDADQLKPKGGGGTAFSPVFTWLGTRSPQPRAIVMVTDGQCSDFGEAPEVPVLWVLTEPNKQFHPPFGEVTFTMNE